LTHISDIDLRSLSDITDDRDVHLSVYLPTGSKGDERANEGFLESRIKAIRNVVSGDIEEDFGRTLSMVSDLLLHDPVPGERGRVVFASAPSGLLQVHRTAIEPERVLVLDNSPFIMPLARLMDDYEDYGIILFDSQRAKVYTVRSKTIAQVDGSRIDLMNKHKKGGMSQKRFNRLRRGAMDRFVKEVVEDLDRVEGLRDIEQFVVAGPGPEKKQLLDALPKHLRDKVIGTMDVDMDVHRDQLEKHTEVLAIAHERAEESSALEDLKVAIYKDELGALGVEEVRDALLAGRVQTLLCLVDLSMVKQICERCKRITGPAGSEGRCPSCGGPTSAADVMEELYEMAESTSAELEVVDDSPFLEEVGGVAAILRY
jgi:peptide chain release factor subunit 1